MLKHSLSIFALLIVVYSVEAVLTVATANGDQNPAKHLSVFQRWMAKMRFP